MNSAAAVLDVRNISRRHEELKVTIGYEYCCYTLYPSEFSSMVTRLRVAVGSKKRAATARRNRRRDDTYVWHYVHMICPCP